MPVKYQKDDPTFGQIDLDDEYITDPWLEIGRAHV